MFLQGKRLFIYKANKICKGIAMTTLCLLCIAILGAILIMF